MKLLGFGIKITDSSYAPFFKYQEVYFLQKSPLYHTDGEVRPFRVKIRMLPLKILVTFKIGSYGLIRQLLEVFTKGWGRLFRSKQWILKLILVGGWMRLFLERKFTFEVLILSENRVLTDYHLTVYLGPFTQFNSHLFTSLYH